MDAFVVELERFEGPLDLLLHLIREQDIDIFDIPIARITQQFLKAIDGVEELGLERAGEFLEMAATLVRIKAQMLLPRRSDEDLELEDPRAELVRRLLEYEHFRDAADRLEDAEADRSRHYGRGFVPPKPRPDLSQLELEVDWGELWDALSELIVRVRPPEEHQINRRVVTLEEKVDLILDTLRRLDRVEFTELLRDHPDKLHAVATLLASLELARRREVAMRQSKPFAPLWIYRRNGDGAAAEADEDDADH
ncbi:MAG TPA: segregation/condensation protein A [Longimicrobiales bacterium]|nr:segregation/condensation protein A [Longimicrobiales bacterium]